MGYLCDFEKQREDALLEIKNVIHIFDFAVYFVRSLGVFAAIHWRFEVENSRTPLWVLHMDFLGLLHLISNHPVDHSFVGSNVVLVVAAAVPSSIALLRFDLFCVSVCCIVFFASDTLHNGVTLLHEWSPPHWRLSRDEMVL
mmetsp:Transcript_27376/g.74855  ORF Transcript_27376/g.74855 Transcript_27376/m.74855 type:complete len:142 (+) Transcript_27376:963-1388(+)